MASGFTTTGSDFDAQFIRREFFQEGQLYGAGTAYLGRLGNNQSAPTSNYSSIVQTISGGLNWKSISVGSQSSAGIKSDGSLWLWGYNGYGQLGTNDRTQYASPVQTISASNTWKQVSCGYNTTTGAIKTDGSLWLWGQNSSGALGDNTTADKSSPVQTVAGGFTWKQLSIGGFFVNAIKTDGTLWGWGRNDTGQLADNTRTNKSSPVQNISSATNWKQVDCGLTHVAAIKTDGTLWVWGQNYLGELGTNQTYATVNGVSSPVQTVSGGNNWKQVSAGTRQTAAVKTDGTLWMWGVNTNGSLGNNTVNSVSSPVQTIAGGTNWKQVASSKGNSAYKVTGAIKTDGTLWMWGKNNYGQLSQNDTTDRSSPIQVTMGITNAWQQVSTGYGHFMAITTIN